jgi:TP901 family phage tail tape measure protein
VIGSSKKALATVMITADPKALEKAIERSKSSLRKFGTSAQKAFGTGFKKVGSMLARSFDPLGKGFALVGDAVDEYRTFEKGIARLAIAQGKSNDEMGGFRAQLTGISKDTGINRNEILAGVSAYQALTGDTRGAAAAAGTFAKVAEASGASVADTATAAAALNQNLKINPADFEAAFDILNTQGKAGAIEIKDLAGELASLAPSFAAFAGGKGLKGMQHMGAALQVVRRGFGSAAEASTGLRNLLNVIGTKGSKIENAIGTGNVFWTDKRGKKHLRDFDVILTNISNSKLMKDPGKLSKALGGNAEAVRALQQLIQNRKDLTALENDTSGAGSIAKDAAQYAQSDAGKLEIAMNNLKLAVASALSPELVQAFASAMQGVSSVVGGIVDGIKDVATNAAELLGGGGPKNDDERVALAREEWNRERRKRVILGGKAGALEDADRAAAKLLTGNVMARNVAGDYFHDNGTGQRMLDRADAEIAREDAAGATYGKGKGTFSELWSARQTVAGSSQPAVAGRGLNAKGDAAVAAAAVAGFGAKGQKPEEVMARVVAAAMGGKALDAKTIERAMKAAIQSVEITVVADGNAIAKAHGNATKHRRRP